MHSRYMTWVQYHKEILIRGQFIILSVGSEVRMSHCECRRQAGWLAGWLAGWVAGWLGGWLAGWLADWLAGWLAG